MHPFEILFILDVLRCLDDSMWNTVYSRGVPWVQAALGVAFMVEGLLLGFHLKGAPLEVLLHKILVITIALSALLMFAEIRSRGSVVLTVGRSLLVGLQGIWFIQIGYILYKGEFAGRTCAWCLWIATCSKGYPHLLPLCVADLPQWDPRSMKSTMMAPALYCLDIMLLTLGALVCAALPPSPPHALLICLLSKVQSGLMPAPLTRALCCSLPGNAASDPEAGSVPAAAAGRGG